MENLTQHIQLMHHFLLTKTTENVNYRLHFLKQLKHHLIASQEEICQALHRDLHKPLAEAYTTEVFFVLQELSYTLKHLKQWATPQKTYAHLPLTTGKTVITPRPYGLTLIFSPYNYPFQLALVPLIGAIAAGNAVVLKLSEFTPSTNKVIRKLIEKVFPSHLVYVVEGEGDVCERLLTEPFDYIFFTGSIRNGKKVAQAAAAHLTPLTLELGGKNPAIIDCTANLEQAAKKIVWGKFLNAGQTCVAPDYLLVHRSVLKPFVARLKYYIDKFYPQFKEGTRLIHEGHFNHVLSCLEENKVIYGGSYDKEQLKIAPTLLYPVTLKDTCMQEEIFGPILPIMTFDKLSVAIDIVRHYPKSLAGYIFAEDKLRQNYLLKHLHFGGGCVNDTLLHMVTPKAPFGGIGYSGMGAYHGKNSFDTFSHYQTIYYGKAHDLPLRYPPYHFVEDVLHTYFSQKRKK